MKNLQTDFEIKPGKNYRLLKCEETIRKTDQYLSDDKWIKYQEEENSSIGEKYFPYDSIHGHLPHRRKINN